MMAPLASIYPTRAFRAAVVMTAVIPGVKASVADLPPNLLPSILDCHLLSRKAVGGVVALLGTENTSCFLLLSGTLRSPRIVCGCRGWRCHK